ncbi:MAG: Stage V sporulation protein T [Eubacteriales bacterium SKADARSKE-1]|nr:Stage V sporulation protein T [Eubacteriales bacterium SKADARSKE-1]
MIFKKYSPVGELSQFATTYCEVLARAANFPTIVCDRDHVVAVAGTSKKEYIERRITAALEDLMENRKSYILKDKGAPPFYPIEGIDKPATIVFPIISSGDVTGAVIMLTSDLDTMPGEVESKLAQTAAVFLGKQMEE